VNPIGVMHLVDTLEAGGAETVAVHLVNQLPRGKYVPYLCTTRREGPLAALVATDVGRLNLKRNARYDLAAIWRLAGFLRVHGVRLLHAHGPALFIARAAAALYGRSTVIWHAHYGGYVIDDWRHSTIYRLATSRIKGVITVNQDLAGWASCRLRVPSTRVWYVPNPACLPPGDTPAVDIVQGTDVRIICVANFRPEKDHLTLIRAMALVVQESPGAHLFLVGDVRNAEYYRSVQREIYFRRLEPNISLLGPRHDVGAILKACHIGVLSSATEGLSVALLEYGMAGLATVATSVGQAVEVLDYGAAGILVPSAQPEILAQALSALVRSPEQRATLGCRFRMYVEKTYGPGPILRQVCQVYDTVLARKNACLAEHQMAELADSNRPCEPL
jgi:glycosyltransferase involved in cell wall biosynthesis